MKFTIVALCIIGYTFAAQGSPKSSSRCSGNFDNLTTCSACYNDGVNTSIGARQWALTNCDTKVANTIASCKYYDPNITSTKKLSDCLECNAVTWLNITGNTAAASITMACSATSLDATTNCKTAVPNCAQSYCYQAAGGTTKVSGCRKCNTGYTGSGVPVPLVGYPTCSTTGIIANCAFAWPYLNTMCWEAKTGYAVTALGTGATTFTSDANCRKLSLGGSWCMYCKNGYYFSGTTCTLGAKLMAVSGLIMSLFFFN